jgi:flagellin FlaB
MKANRLARDEKGDFGIGTMIIFIAMIVVAVVAATVIIETMNKLQSSAKSTGDQAITQVSSGLHVKSVLGDRTDTSLFTMPAVGGISRPGFMPEKVSSLVQRLNVLVELRAGSLPIDLDRTIFRIVTPRDVVTYAGTPLGKEETKSFSGVTSVRDNDGSLDNDHVLDHSGDIAAITIDVEDLGIGAGESFTIQIVPDVGGIATTTTVTMPLSYPHDAVQIALYP